MRTEPSDGSWYADRGGNVGSVGFEAGGIRVLVGRLRCALSCPTAPGSRAVSGVNNVCGRR
eukprot:103839-Chlamydomonas_euryale.AAC.3